METRNLAELYGAPPVNWDEVRRRLDAGFDQTLDAREVRAGTPPGWPRSTTTAVRT